MLSKESKTPSCWRANSGLLLRCHHQSTMVFDNLINAVTCWWFFKEVCSRVRSAWVESETRTCIQRLELNQSSPLFKVSFKLNTLLCYISLFSGCWNLDINLNTCTEIFMTQQCLQFERRWCPWHRLILRSRKPGVNSLKDRLCEHLSSSLSQCANVSGQRVLHQLLCHGLAKHGVLLVQVVVSLAFHQYCQYGQRLWFMLTHCNDQRQLPGQHICGRLVHEGGCVSHPGW